MAHQSDEPFEWVDFHCHLDLYSDLKNSFFQPSKTRTATLAVTTTPKSFLKNKAAAKGNSFVRVALGLHPQLVDERWREIDLFERLVGETRYIGEVGLDFGPNFKSSIDIQEDVFRKILQLCAISKNKILSIHSVRAATRVMTHLEKYFHDGNGKAVLHWFSGSTNELKRASEFGCYFSVNERMVLSDKGRKLIEEMPIDKILTETDGPFIARAGKPLSPGQVRNTVNELASIKSLTPEKMRVQVLRNLRQLVS